MALEVPDQLDFTIIGQKKKGFVGAWIVETAALLFS